MTRTLVDLDIELTSPLVVGDRKSTNFHVASMKYVPGRVVRGAVANALLGEFPHDRRRCASECDFCSLLVDEAGVIFRNAWPSAEWGVARPLPLTLVKCKKDGDHPAFDTLLERLSASLRGTLFNPRCSCGGRSERQAGFGSVTAGSVQTVPAPMSVQLTRVGIDRARRAASDEILYSLIALREQNNGVPTRFQATLDCPAEHAGTLSEFLNSGRVASFGGATSRGLGSARVKATPHVTPAAPLRQRLDMFNDALVQQMEKERQPGVVPLRPPFDGLAADVTRRLKQREAAFFTVGLISDAVLQDSQTGLADFVLHPEMLADAARCDAEVSLVWSCASYATRTGWNAAWGLPRCVETVATAGSVFVYHTANRAAWADALERLEAGGVGFRVNEGFGQVEVCSPWHGRMKGAPKK